MGSWRGRLGWGKLVGGAAGLLLGGALGALAGLILGHDLDRRLRGRVVRLRRDPPSVVFFRTVFATLGRMAKADGWVSEAEVAWAREALRRLGVPGPLRAEARRLFAQGRDPAYEAASAARALREACRGREEALSLHYFLQAGCAFADGPPHPAQRRLLDQLAEALGLSEAERARLEREAAASARPRGRPGVAGLEEAYRTLGLEPGAGPEAVRRAYRRLMSRYHPDKAAARGLDRIGARRALEQAQAVQAAYARLRRAGRA